MLIEYANCWFTRSRGMDGSIRKFPSTTVSTNQPAVQFCQIQLQFSWVESVAKSTATGVISRLAAETSENLLRREKFIW